MRVEEIVPSSSATGVAMSTEMPVRLAEQLQRLDIAAAALAEGEVLAGHHAGRADPAGEMIGDELRARSRRRSAASKWKTSIASTPAAASSACALVEIGQAEGRQIGPEEARRVRIEGRDQGRPALGPRARDGAADHRLVAGMKSVEIAERDDAAAKRGRNRRAPVQALHGARL